MDPDGHRSEGVTKSPGITRKVNAFSRKNLGASGSIGGFPSLAKIQLPDLGWEPRLFGTGKRLDRVERASFGTGKRLDRVKQASFRTGKPLDRVKQALFRTGKRLDRVERASFRTGKWLDRVKRASFRAAGLARRRERKLGLRFGGDPADSSHGQDSLQGGIVKPFDQKPETTAELLIVGGGLIRQDQHLVIFRAAGGFAQRGH